MTIHERLGQFGKSLAIGFADKIAIGMFLGFLDDVTPEDLYPYLKENKSRVTEVFAEISDEELQEFRGYAHQYFTKAPSVDDLLKALQKRRTELFSLLINHPTGKEWLKNELDTCIEKIK
ncbi:unnamed protein product [marine sediment metagenome]|uniref:Uncharacterized protein n=1 Tax=marine sediment metagenome TaxID=412755 RepID=X1MQU0_9ZZZZ